MNPHRFIEKLLNGQAVEWKPLGEVVKMQRGKTITAKNAVDGDVPVISGGQKPAYYHNEHNREGKTITVAGSGAYAGFVMYWEKPIFVSDAFSIQSDENLLNIKYIYHFLLQNQNALFGMKKGSGVPHVYPKDVATLKIPIPPLSVQAKIAKILDAFTTITAELTAELSMRNKQYQYYRDKLLTFELESAQSLATARDSSRQLATARDSSRQLATARDSSRQLATASDSGRQWCGRLWGRLVSLFVAMAYRKKILLKQVYLPFTMGRFTPIMVHSPIKQNLLYQNKLLAN